MKKNLNIAIYSGNLPSSTFIENLIKGVATKHHVFLFGKQQENYSNSKFQNPNSNIHVFGYARSNSLAIFQTFVRTLLLAFLSPTRFGVLRDQISKQNSNYQKRLAWIKITPVLLHLPDIFHIQWAKDLDKWLFLKELDVKIVLSLRGAHINYSPIADSHLEGRYIRDFPKVDAFHAVSDAIGLEAQKYGANPNKIKTIHSLIPEEIFSLFGELPLRPDDKLKLISVGRHHWIKGYDLAIDACSILKERGIPFSYTIIAGGKVPEELLFKRHQLKLEEEISFIDQLPQKKVFEKMKQSDVLLLSSLKEGIANVVIEAMAIGTPVVSADCGGMLEVVIPEETGWIFENMNSTTMAETLITFYNTDFEKKQRVVQKAHQMIQSNFNSEVNIQLFFDLYESLIKQK